MLILLDSTRYPDSASLRVAILIFDVQEEISATLMDPSRSAKAQDRSCVEWLIPYGSDLDDSRDSTR